MLKVVRGVDGADGVGERWNEEENADSKNCWSSSSARITMRNVGRVMWRGLAGSSARFAEAGLWGFFGVGRDKAEN